MKKDLPIVCFCVIFYKGRILLLRRSPSDMSHPNTWWFPGGHVEEGETLEQGVIREVYEESDILLDPSRVFLIKKDVSTKGKPLFLFVAEILSPLVALKDGEHIDFAWVTPYDLLNYNRTPTFISYTNEAIMFQSSQYGLTSLSAPGSVYAEAAIAPSQGSVVQKGLVSDKAKVNPYSAPIIFKRNGDCESCGGATNLGAAAGGCGCPSKSSSLGSLYLPARKKAIIYSGFGAPKFWSESSSTQKFVYVLLALALLGGAGVIRKQL